MSKRSRKPAQSLPPDAKKEGQVRWWIAAGLVGAVLVVYWQVTQAEFVSFDDRDYVVLNANIHNGFTLDMLKWAFGFYVSNWHPLTWLSHALDWQLFGGHPGGHHVMNVVFHVANTLLLFWLFLRFGGGAWKAGFAAGLFALHPLHVESVAWVAERKDVLSTLFWLLTIHAYVSFAAKRTPGWYALTLVLFAFGLMAKPMVVSLPVILLLLDYWPLRRISWGTVFEKAPMYVMSLGSAVLTFKAQEMWGSVATTYGLPVSDRLSNACVSYVIYLWQIVWPIDLSFFYPHPKTSLALWVVIGSVLLLIAFSIVAIRLGKSTFTGWFWYLVTLVPVIGVVQVGAQAHADRYTYVPLIGIFMALAWGVPELARRFRVSPKALVPVGLAVLVTCAGLSYRQVGYWRNGESLFSHAIDLDPNNFMALGSLGLIAYQNGEYERAQRLYTRSLELEPINAEANNGLGATLGQIGMLPEAIECFRKAIRIYPSFAHRKIGEAYYNIGIAEGTLNRFGDAVKDFEASLQHDPNQPKARFYLGKALYQVGKPMDALEQFREVVKEEPGNIEALTWVAELSRVLGKPADSIAAYETLSRLDPKKAVFHSHLAELYFHARRYQEAATAARLAKENGSPISTELDAAIRRALQGR